MREDPANATLDPVRKRVKPLAALESLSGWTSRIAGVVAVIALLTSAGTMLAGVFFRYVLNNSLDWSEELAGFMLIYLSLAGSLVSYHRGDQMALTMVVDQLKGRARETAASARDGAILSLVFVLIPYGWQLSAVVANHPTPALGISQSWVYGAIPLFGVLIGVEAVRQIARRGDWLSWASAAIAIAVILTVMLFIQPNPAWVLGVTLLATLLIGVPIGFALAISGMAALGSQSGSTALTVVPLHMADGVNSVLLLAIPFFMLTGTVMAAGGFSRKLVDFVGIFVGRMRGGLAMTDILVSMIFADISGSAAADSAAIGSVIIPEMVRRGYQPRYAAALQAAAGTMGLMFPPATALIIYAFIAQVSVAALFEAAFVPGLLVAASFLVLARLLAVRHGHPSETGRQRREAFGIGLRAVPPLITIVIILGGILDGIFTPTEAGVVAAVYALIISLFWRELTLRRVPGVVLEAAVLSGRVTFIIAGAAIMGYVLTILQVPQTAALLLPKLITNPIVMLLAINLLLIVVHSTMETVASMLVTVPVLLPVVAHVGYDPVAFGIVVVINSAIGLILPPVCINTYLTAAIAKERVEVVARTVIPFAVCLVVDVILVSVFPDLALWLPRHAGH